MPLIHTVVQFLIEIQPIKLQWKSNEKAIEVKMLVKNVVRKIIEMIIY